MEQHIHIEIKEGAIATFTKTPTPEVLVMIRKLIEKAEKQVNKNFIQPDVSSSFFCANEYHKTGNGCNNQCERCRLNQHTYRKLRKAYRGEVKK